MNPPAPVAPGSDEAHEPVPGDGGAQADPTRRPANPLTLTGDRAVQFDLWWPRLTAVAALAGYLLVGYWLLHGLHYAVGDALARSSFARSIVDSRDPHLSAIGFVWMPLPTFAQLPITAVLSPLGWAYYSGMVATSLAGAATVPVVARIAQDLGVRRPRAVLITVCYAVSPFTILYAANGMSEAPAALFTALAVRRFIAWSRHRRVRDLGGLGICLGLLTLCRYEGLVVAAVLAGAAALWSPRGERRFTAMVVAVPSVFVLACWSVVCRLLLDDWLFWLHGLEAVADPPTDAPWLPQTRNLLTVGGYALRLALIVAPVLVVIVPLLLRSRGSGARRLPAALLLVGAVYPAQVIATVLRGDGWGNLRYFSPLVLIATVLALWRCADTRGGWRLVTAALLVGLASGSAAIASPRITAVESEYAILRAEGGDAPAGFPLDAFLGAAGHLDANTAPDDLIAADSASAFAVTLFSRHPERFAITQDTDFEQLVARAPTRFTWVVTVTGSREAASGSSLGGVLDAPPPGMAWTEAAQFSQRSVDVTLFRLVPAGA